MWSNEKFLKLSPILPSGQALWIYLNTGPKTTELTGLFKAGRSSMSEDLGWSEEEFLNMFCELEDEGLVEASWENKVIWVPAAIRYKKPTTLQIAKWYELWNSIPDCHVKFKAYENFCFILGSYGKPLQTAFIKFCKRPNYGMNDDNDLTSYFGAQDKEEIAGMETFNRFWYAYPRKVGKSKSLAIWKIKNLHLQIESILQDLYARKDWNPNNPYVPHPQTYLNGRRWEDEHKNQPSITAEKKETLIEAAIRIDMEMMNKKNETE